MVGFEVGQALDGTERVKLAVSRVPFACVDYDARIRVSVTERVDLCGRFVPPAHTQHRLVKKRLIERVGHVPVAQIACARAVRGLPKQQVQTHAGRMHAFGLRDDPETNGPLDVFFGWTSRTLHRPTRT